ncbi:MAG TPA: acyltransferase [Oceanospirillales bacterium]|nr:acyltransferase [Oleispira sp.]HCM06631.1 acyltransferase [Oceanospirillales bacterium]|tara:strand:- start:18877 stop:20010 length:1134 start_codon:yes stop_codon:yes gene_type:complete
MDEFADIRPYNDTEFPQILERLLIEPDLVKGLAQFMRPNWRGPLRLLARSLVRWRLQRDLSKLESIEQFQQWLAGYVEKIITKTTTGLYVEGLDRLTSASSHVWLSNHRDIALDPTLVNYALHINDRQTGRIAIGDNLLKNPVVGDVMRLNKSFIVKRSIVAKREKLSALQLLSKYIRHSIEEGQSVWIAQREGRAKNGIDETDTAVLKMLGLAGRVNKESFATSLQVLNPIPVSISYEFDPCDILKARELAAKAIGEDYQKTENEDVISIVTGLMGKKGRIQVTFGKEIDDEAFASALSLAEEVDRQIVAGYACFPINFAAHKLLSDLGHVEPLADYGDIQPGLDVIQQRAGDESDAVKYQLYSMYAQPVIRKKLK